MKNKNISFYYLFIFVLVVSVIILVESVGKPYLNNYLKDYEDSQYKHVAQSFLEDNFNAGGAEALAKLFSSQISELESQETIRVFFEEIIQGTSFSNQSISQGLNEDIKYIIKNSDNLKIATLTVAPTGEYSHHGFELYEPSDVELNVNLLKSFSIEIPIGYHLKANGFSVDEKYCLNDKIYTDTQNFMPGGMDGIVYTTYQLNKMCAEPNFEVTSPDGIVTKIELLENGVYRADIVFNDKLAAEFSDYVIEATKAYACYLQKDAYFSSVSKYLDPSSSLYKMISSSPNWMVIDHTSYAFEDVTASEFYSYSDDVFSCRVTLTHVLKYPRLEDYRDSLDITWYLRKINNKFLIYNSYTR